MISNNILHIWWHHSNWLVKSTVQSLISIKNNSSSAKLWLKFNVSLSKLRLTSLLKQATELLRVNTLRPRQNGCHFTDDIFKGIFLNENVLISIKISLKFVSKCPINNIPTLVQMMAWRRPGDKPLSEPVMVRLLTHTCVTRPQWVNNREGD